MDARRSLRDIGYARVVRALLLTLAGLAVLSIACLLLVGIHPVLPSPFIVNLLLLLPWAWALHVVLRAAERRILPSLAPMAGFVLAAGVLLALSAPGRLPVAEFALIVLFLTVLLARRPADSTAGAVKGLVAVVLGNASVWSLNYMALMAARGRIADPGFRTFDAWLYQVLLGHAVIYSGLFPLVNRPLALSGFEGGYLMFFPEIMVVAFVLGHDSRRLAEYLTRMFACYAAALAVFILVPVAGPYLAFPDSVRSVFDNRPTGFLMQSGQREYSAVLHGLQPITGFGNFVGFPSLHAAMVVIFQSSFRRFRLTFWTFLPINLLLLAATIVLGYHYIVDVVAGLMLGWGAVRLIRFGPGDRAAASTGAAVPDVEPQESVANAVCPSS